MVKGSTTNSLMKHIRDNHNISINGSRQKTNLINMGYYHGYKGYRFIKDVTNKPPYNDFEEITVVYKFDMKIKSLFYPHIMFIETAIKNRILETLVGYGNMDLETVFNKHLTSYQQYQSSDNRYHKAMKSRLQLREKIYSAVSYNYTNKEPVIQHFYHSNKPLPLWAIFEVISLGYLGNFYKCLNNQIKTEVNKRMKTLGTRVNQDGNELSNIIFLLKDLRNSVAHNSIIFDCRFKKANINISVTRYIEEMTGVLNVRFNHITDYFVLLAFLLKQLGVDKSEIQQLIKDLKVSADNLYQKVPHQAYAQIMGSDFRTKIYSLEQFIRN